MVDTIAMRCSKRGLTREERTMSDKPLVRYDVEDGIGVITVDNPPVNALSPGVPEGIMEAMDRAEADPNVKALVLIGAGRSFIAGADIRQFGKPRVVPARRPYDHLDLGTKPIVAAIHGYALGGGLENALACHYRIAVPSAKVGLPEVNIGILPGGGGTQRLPRLIGPKAAMELIVSGRHVGTEEAQRLGIVDAIVEGKDLRVEAIAYAKSIADRRPLPRVRDRTDQLAAAQSDPGMFEAMRKSIARRARNQKAPYHCIAAVEAATREPFEQGMKTEQKLFAELENADEARALRYAFFAEREVTKIPGLDESLKLPELKKVAVVGAGTMGGGIAMSFADFGQSVRILEVTPEAMSRGMQRIKDNYAISVKRGSVAQEEVDRRLPRIVPVASYEAIADCDVVIEAVYEEMPVKKQVFAKLDAVMQPQALLLTNSSALDVDELARTTKRAKQVAGAHFFSPANVMKLLEVVAGKDSAPTTLAAAMKMGRSIGKIAAYAGNTDGFVANRSRAPFNTEMVLMVEEGAQPEEVDQVMVDFGYPMGPFAVGDLAGLDIGAASRRRRAAADPGYRKLPIPDRLVEMGRYGQKTGAGWFRYEKGDRTPHPDPVTKQVIREVAEELKIPQRTFTADEILRRLLFASLNEACKILEEGKALRASDIDVMWLHGFGFPRYRGGLMFWADGIGSKAVYEQIEEWHQRYGARWQPSALLKDTAAKGGAFRELKGA